MGASFPLSDYRLEPFVSGLMEYRQKNDAVRTRNLAVAVLDQARSFGIGDGFEVGDVLNEADKCLKTLSLAADKIAAEEGTRVLQAVDIHDLALMHFQERQLLLAPFLHSQDLGMLFAPRGIGKTQFAVALAFAVATGGKFLSWQADAPKKVVYLDGELPGNVLQRRLAMHLPVDREPAPGFLRIFTPDLPSMEGRSLPDLSTREGQDEIDAMLEPDTALVIVDNLSAWARSGRENEAESWHPMSTWMLALRRRGIAVLLVHHAGKGGEQRGTSKKEDLLDFVIKLSRPRDYNPKQGAAFVLEFTKSRHLVGEAAETLEIALQGDEDGPATWTWKTVENSTFDRVVALTNESMTPGEIAVELAINKSTVSRHLKRARDEGKLSGGAK